MQVYKNVWKKILRGKRERMDVRQYNCLCEELGERRFFAHKKDFYYIYEDESNAAVLDSHYFLQDYYLAKKINEMSPKNHYDIGSRVDGFITHLLSAGTHVTMLDIRPFSIEMEGLDFIQTDATNMKGIPDNSLESISSLHAIEHFGLGRYGDEIDPIAYKKVLKAIQCKMKKGGLFYLGIPCGKEEKVCFNAHRIFNPNTIIENLDEMRLVEFSYIQDFKICKVDIGEMDSISQKLGSMDCGLFVFVKN